MFRAAKRRLGKLGSTQFAYVQRLCDNWRRLLVRRLLIVDYAEICQGSPG
jgi:hypothetical protein